MKLRVVTWNMDHWKHRSDLDHTRKAWEHLAKLNPNVALVQEAVPPPGTLASTWTVVPAVHDAARWTTSATQRWGTAVVGVDPSLRISEIKVTRVGEPRDRGSLTISHPGAYCAAELTLSNGRRLHLVSVYGLLEGPLRNGTTYAVTTVHRTLSDLTPLLDVARARKVPVILGGDFNVSTQVPRPDREAHRLVLKRLDAFGLGDCLRDCRAPPPRISEGCPCDEGTECRHVQTHRHSRSKKPWQNDYVFASRTLLPSVAGTVNNAADNPAWELSDHCPVVVDLDV
jgi:exonuclease III